MGKYRLTRRGEIVRDIASALGLALLLSGASAMLALTIFVWWGLI